MEGNERCSTSASSADAFSKTVKTKTTSSAVKKDGKLQYVGALKKDCTEEETEPSFTTQVHFGSRPDVQDGEVYARYLFNIRKQEAKESFESFLESLQTLSSCCNFDVLQDSLVRDRVVVGVSDGGLRGRLLQEPRLTLARCVELCRQHQPASSHLPHAAGETDPDIPGPSVRGRPLQSVPGPGHAGHAKEEWIEGKLSVSPASLHGVTAIQCRTPNSSSVTGFSGLQGLSILDSTAFSPSLLLPASLPPAAAAVSPPPDVSLEPDDDPKPTRTRKRKPALRLRKDREPSRKLSKVIQEKPCHICRECGRNFSDLQMLQSHQVLEHGFDNISAEAGVSGGHRCGCGKTFKDQRQLRSHRCRRKSSEKSRSAVTPTPALRSVQSRAGSVGKSRTAIKEVRISIPKLEVPQFSDDDEEEEEADSFHVDIPNQRSPPPQKDNKSLGKKTGAVVNVNSEDQFVRHCSHCKKGFTEADVQSRNFYSHQRRCLKAECTICKATISTTYMATHMRRIHNAAVFKCMRCTRVFVSEDELKSHWVSSGHPANEEYKDDSSLDHVCHLCLRVFSSFPLLARHLQTFVHDKPPQFVCSLCGHSIMSRSSLHLHMQEDHGRGGTSDADDFVTCSCGLGFLEKKQLSRHRSVCKASQRKLSEDTSVKSHGGVDKFTMNSERSFTCCICQTVYSVWSDFDRHLVESGHEQEGWKGGSDRERDRQEGETYTCRLCQAKFPDKEDLTQHLLGEAHQQDLGSLQCPVCKKLFAHDKALQTHRQTHLQDGNTQRKFQNTSEKRSSTSTSTKPESNSAFHQGEQMSSRDSVVVEDSVGDGLHEGKADSIVCQCPYCNQGFTEEELQNQEFEAHKHSCKKFACSVCSEIFPDRSSLARHAKKTGHEQKFPAEMYMDDSSSWKEVYPCPLCSKTFPTKRQLNRHMVGPVHREDPSSRQCHICHKVFKRKGSLREHLQSHSDERPFVCEVCGRGFKKWAILCSHRLIHTGLQNCKCEFCGKEFHQRAYLKKHRRLHTGERPYQCHLCGRRFHINSHLLMHIRLHTGERPYKCDTCGKTFVKLCHLKGHKATHSDERPWPCSTCGKAFKTRIEVKAHEFLHTGIKKFVCQACGMSFARSGSLYQHMRKYHPDMARTVCPKRPRQSTVANALPPQPHPQPPPPLPLLCLSPSPSPSECWDISAVMAVSSDELASPST